MPKIRKPAVHHKKFLLLTPLGKYHNGVLVLFILFLSVIFQNAARADFASDYQGFLKTYGAYRIAHNDYQTTRNQYLQYGTLNSQTAALEAVKRFLLQRDDVVLSFISLIRQKATDPVYLTLLNDEENFHKTHKERVPAVASLDDSVRISREAEDHHIPLQRNVRKITTSILLDRVVALKDRFLALDEDAGRLILILKSQDKDVSTLERWRLDAKNKELLAEQKLLAAQNKIIALSGGSVEVLTQNFNEIQIILSEANQYLNEGLTFMGELAETMKYGNY